MDIRRLGDGGGREEVDEDSVEVFVSARSAGSAEVEADIGRMACPSSAKALACPIVYEVGRTDEIVEVTLRTHR